jgi:hypothetical protein
VAVDAKAADSPVQTIKITREIKSPPGGICLGGDNKIEMMVEVRNEVAKRSRTAR